MRLGKALIEVGGACLALGLLLGIQAAPQQQQLIFQGICIFLIVLGGLILLVAKVREGVK